jgi:hypothetical protein
MRKSLGWNTKLPVYGSGAMLAMKIYQDREDTEFNKTKDDDGQHFYCVCWSDVKQNILYSPYDLKIIKSSEINKYDIHFVITATAITRVNKQQQKLTAQEILPFFFDSKI